MSIRLSFHVIRFCSCCVDFFDDSTFLFAFFFTTCVQLCGFCGCEDLYNFFEVIDFLFEFLLFLFVCLPICIGSGAFSPCGGLFRHFCGFVVSCGFVVLCTLLCTL